MLDELMKKLLDIFLVVHFHPNNAVKPFKFERQNFQVVLRLRFFVKTALAYLKKQLAPMHTLLTF